MWKSFFSHKTIWLCTLPTKAVGRRLVSGSWASEGNIIITHYPVHSLPRRPHLACWQTDIHSVASKERFLQPHQMDRSIQNMLILKCSINNLQSSILPSSNSTPNSISTPTQLHLHSKSIQLPKSWVGVMPYNWFAPPTHPPTTHSTFLTYKTK